MTVKTFIMAIALTTFIGCRDEIKVEERKWTAKELKAELKKMESVDSLNYISVKLLDFSEKFICVRERGLFRDAEYKSDGWYIEGELTNSAILANFKDAVLLVSFFSKTKTQIEKKEMVVYDFLKAQQSIGFQLKVNPPNGTDSISLALKSVTPIKKDI